MNNGPLWVDLKGLKVDSSEIPVLQHKNTGGVILFTKNYENKNQLQTLVQSIRELAKKPVHIGVDHEGGRVWRFDKGFTKIPPMHDFGQMYEEDKAKASFAIKEAAETVGRELKECDIDLTFAPVLDLDHGVSDVIGNRSFNRDPEIVTECARAFIQGLQKHNVYSVGKHFPGHGACSMDSHFITAADPRPYSEIEANDLIPFQRLSDLLMGIMPAHVLYPEVDTNITTFSKKWLQDVLRTKLGFKGKIISDCLSMKGSGYDSNIAAGVRKALDAGCDMVITTQQIKKYDIMDVLNSIILFRLY